MVKDFGVSIAEFQRHLHEDPALYISALNASICASAMRKLPDFLCKDARIQREVASTVDAAGDDMLQFFLALDTSTANDQKQQVNPSSSFVVTPQLDEPHAPHGLVSIHDDRPSWGQGPRRSKKGRR